VIATIASTVENALNMVDVEKGGRLTIDIRLAGNG
jgi:hypothetical protein